MKTGFTLVELMIIITIISILAVLTIPMYQSYVIRAQIINAISDTETYKTYASYTYSQTGECPPQSELNLLSNTLSPTSYIQSISITAPDKNTCSLNFLLKSSNTSLKIKNKSLVFTLKSNENLENDAIHWVCSASDIKQIYLPKNCSGS